MNDGIRRGEELNYIDDLIRRTVEALPTILTNGILSAFEPIKEKFVVRPGQVGAITRTIRSLEHNEIKRFASPKGRNDFLWSTTRYLEELGDHEEMLVAIGRRRGQDRTSPSMLEGVWKGIGDQHSVSFTPLITDLIGKQMGVDHGDIIVVHNHPRYDVKTLLSLFVGWRPLPSSQDREVAFRANLSAFANYLNRGQGAVFRWYLVDEGELLEFFLPSIERILNAIK